MRFRWFSILGLALAAVPAAADDEPAYDPRSLYDVSSFTADQANTAEAQRNQQIMQIVQQMGWQQNLQCPQVTPNECFDPSWAQTPCGMLDAYQRLTQQQGSGCSSVVGGIVQQQLQQYPNLPWDLVAQGDGSLIYSQKVPAQTLGYAWDGIRTTYMAEVEETAALAKTDPTSPVAKHAAWDSSMAIRSCEEYVWEKWYDWSKFEDGAAALTGDDRAIFDRAYDPTTGIAYKAIYSRAPVPVKQKDVMWPTGALPKNTYFLFEKTAFDKFPFDPSVLPDPSGRADHTASWAWHKSMSDKYASGWTSVPDATLNYEYSRQVAFHKLLVKRGELLEALEAEALGTPPVETSITASVTGVGGMIEYATFAPVATAGAIAALPVSSVDSVVTSSSGGSPVVSVTDPSGAVVGSYATGGYTGKLGQLYILDNAINGYLEHARDQGCLAVGWPAACDWSPALFADSLKGQFATERESDYQACFEATGNDFTASSTIANPSAYGIPFAMAGVDYRKDSEAVRAFMALWKIYLSDFTDFTPEPGSPSSPSTGWWRTDRQQFGDKDKWDVGYEYRVGYGVLKNSGAKAGMCDTDLRAEVMAKGFAHLNGTRYDIIDGDNLIGSQDGLFQAHAYLKVFGKELYNLGDIKAKFDIEPLKFNVVAKLSASGTIWIGWVPVTAEIGVTGEAGIKLHMTGAVTRVCPDGGPATFDIAASVDAGPYVNVDAFGSVGVGVSGLEAKLQVELALLHVKLPFALSASLRPTDPTKLSTLQLAADASLALTLNTLKGRVLGILETPFGSPSFEIFSWKGYELVEPLWTKHWKVPVSTVLSKI